MNQNLAPHNQFQALLLSSDLDNTSVRMAVLFALAAIDATWPWWEKKAAAEASLDIESDSGGIRQQIRATARESDNKRSRD